MPVPKKQKNVYADAEQMAEKQRTISVSEFFSKNRHLLGFDNPRRALLTAVKEAVDNSLDACEEAGILPDLTVTLKELSEDRFSMSVEDNGPGIVKNQIPNIFAKLLYGSKFHSMKMSRGQQGIGISAAGMYGQLTTGQLIKMLKTTNSRALKGALQSDFSRVSSKVAGEICAAANLNPNASPKAIALKEADNLFRAIQKVKIMNPPTDCISPIGEDLIVSGLKQQVEAEIFVATTRPPSVYRGNPFQIEAGIAYGGKLPGDELAQVFRFANRVPLLYQQSACAIFKTVQGIDWKNYGLDQARGALPSGPLVIMVHMASVWVPFTSESKEAIASYDEVIKEMRLALQECGRKISAHISHKRRVADALQKINYIQTYIPQIGIALKDILGLNEKEVKRAVTTLTEVLEKKRAI